MKELTIDSLVLFIEQLTQRAPLEVVVLIGTFVEEVFSPLPSFIVLVPSGVAAQVQGHPVWYLGILALFSGIGRIAGATILYHVADKLENRLLRRRRIFGFSHEQIESLGSRLGKSVRRDWGLLFVMSAIPIFPTAVLSLACGFIKVPYKLFISATFFGTLINAMIYMSIGYGGLAAAETLDGFEVASQVVTALLVLAAVTWLIYRRRVLRAALRTEPVPVPKQVFAKKGTGTKKGRQG